jgi:hypothetical protein
MSLNVNHVAAREEKKETFWIIELLSSFLRKNQITTGFVMKGKVINLDNLSGYFANSRRTV